MSHFINSLTYLATFSFILSSIPLGAIFLFGVSDQEILFIFSENRDSVHHGNLVSIFPFIFKRGK